MSIIRQHHVGVTPIGLDHGQGLTGMDPVMVDVSIALRIEGQPDARTSGLHELTFLVDGLGDWPNGFDDDGRIFSASSNGAMHPAGMHQKEQDECRRPHEVHMTRSPMRMFPSGQWNEMPLGPPTFVSREDLLSLWLDLTALLRPTVEGLRVRTDDIGDLRIGPSGGDPSCASNCTKGMSVSMRFRCTIIRTFSLKPLADQRTGLVHCGSSAQVRWTILAPDLRCSMSCGHRLILIHV